MADSDKMAAFKPTLVLDEGEIISIQIKRPKRNGEGDETSPAKGVIAFEFDMDRLVQYVGSLSRILKRSRGVQLGLSFVEQLELEARKETAQQNGSGPKATGLEPIAPGNGTKPTKKRETAKA